MFGGAGETNGLGDLLTQNDTPRPQPQPQQAFLYEPDLAPVRERRSAFLYDQYPESEPQPESEPYKGFLYYADPGRETPTRRPPTPPVRWPYGASPQLPSPLLLPRRQSLPRQPSTNNPYMTELNRNNELPESDFDDTIGYSSDQPNTINNSSRRNSYSAPQMPPGYVVVDYPIDAPEYKETDLDEIEYSTPLKLPRRNNSLGRNSYCSARVLPRYNTVADVQITKPERKETDLDEEYITPPRLPRSNKSLRQNSYSSAQVSPNASQNLVIIDDPKSTNSNSTYSYV